MSSPKLIATGAFRHGPPRQAHFRASDLPKGSVRTKGEKGYDGKHESPEMHRHLWDERVKAGSKPRRAQPGTSGERALGRLSYGQAAGWTALGATGGAAALVVGPRNAKKIRETPLDQKVNYHPKPVKKALKGMPGMPLVNRAKVRGGVHTVTSMPTRGDKVRSKLRSLSDRERRFAATASDESVGSALEAGGALAGLGLATGGVLIGSRPVRRAQEDRRKAQVAARRAAKKGTLTPVGKKFQPRLVANAVRHPSEMRRVIRENPWEAGIAVGGAGVGGAAGARDRHHPNRTAAAGVAGAGLGQAGYYGVGFGAIARSEKLKRRGQKEGHNGLSRSAQEAIWRKHRKEHGYSQGQPMTTAQQRNVFQSYPKELPGWRTQRLAAHMQRGKYGRAILTGATLGGAAMVGGASAVGHKQKVGKALYAREDRVSIIRAGELAVGGTLAAYGIGNSGMVGRGIERGIKIAQRNGNEQAVDALRRAEAARGSIRVGMAPGEAALRRIHAVDVAIRKVPKPIRAEVALVAGAMLGARALPVRRTHYTPVSTPVPAYGAGW